MCRFVISKPLVVSTVVGVTTPEQLREILTAADKGALPQDIMQAIEAIHAAFPNPNP